MKRSLFISLALLTTLSFMAFAVLDRSKAAKDLKEKYRASVIVDKSLVSTTGKEIAPDLVYKIDSRFMTTITKENLHLATSVLDIVPEVADGWRKVAFQSIKVAILEDGDEITAMGDEKVLNTEQIKLLRSADYSDDFYIKARGKNNHPETGRIEDYVYYFTIIPEKEAEFKGGYQGLIEILKENIRNETANIKQERLRPGRVSFIVTKNGSVANVELDSSSGYPSIDKLLVESISTLPDNWVPATNTKGEKVNQELIFFFGQEGC